MERAKNPFIRQLFSLEIGYIYRQGKSGFEMSEGVLMIA